MLFSVIVPSYNSERYISECVESVLRQTFTDWELILVNDGSDDGTPKLLEQYATDGRIAVFHTPNGGASSARNFGIKQAKGDYAVFLDADDFFKEDYLARLAEIVSEKKVDVFLGSARTDYYGDANSKDCTLFDCNIANTLDISELLPFFLSYADDAPCACWHNVYSLNYLKNNDLLFDSNLVLSEDRDHLFRVLLSRPSTICINVLGYVHRVNSENSVTSTIDEAKLIGSLHFVEKWMCSCRKGIMPQQCAPWLSRDYCRAICQSVQLDKKHRVILRKEALRCVECLDYLIGGKIITHLLRALPFGRWTVVLGRSLNYATRKLTKLEWWLCHFNLLRNLAE